jgi:hypothetical protein
MSLFNAAGQLLSIELVSIFEYFSLIYSMAHTDPRVYGNWLNIINSTILLGNNNPVRIFVLCPQIWLH